MHFSLFIFAFGRVIIKPSTCKGLERRDRAARFKRSGCFRSQEGVFGMDKLQALKILRDNTVFWSRLGFCYDPPILDDNGEPLVFNKNFKGQLRFHDAFSDVGVKIHTCILHGGWVGVDQYDYSLCDKVLETIFSSGKTEYFIPRIKLNVPVEWCRENPTEVFVYEKGPRDAEEIRALVGTPRHDWFGGERKAGYRTHGQGENAFFDTRPNVGGLISMQSFSSKKWLEDAGEALRRLVQHLENSPWGERILGYHIGFGGAAESMLWGRSAGKFGDYGVTNQRRFYEWGIQKYGSKEAMVEAWGERCLEEVVPPSELREKSHIASDDFYKDEIADRWSIDYDLYMSEITTDALIHFGSVVKQVTEDKPVGSFYGYILHMARCAYSGHLGWKRLLESDKLDFFAAPKSYRRCKPGEPGGVMAPTVSINRTKLWVDECDNRTHLVYSENLGNASCPEETYTVMLRELCKNLTQNSGMWYMDLGGGWYDDPGIMAHVSALVKASGELRRKQHRSVAQVTVIVDEYSILCTHPSVVRHTENLLRDLCLTGTPVEVIFSHDVGKIDLSRTRLAVLLTPRYLDDSFITELRRELSPDARLLYCGKTKASNGVTLIDVPERAYPTYVIRQADGCTPIGEREDGVIAVRNEQGDYIVGDLNAGVGLLRRIVEGAGVHCYAPEECTVYADNRIVSFFPRLDMSFIPSLPKPQRMTDLLSGKEY